MTPSFARLAPVALKQQKTTDALRLYAYAARHSTPMRKHDFPRAFLLYMSLGYLYIDQDRFETDTDALRLLLPDEFEPIWQEAQTMSSTDGVAYIRHLAQQLS